MDQIDERKVQRALVLKQFIDQLEPEDKEFVLRELLSLNKNDGNNVEIKEENSSPQDLNCHQGMGHSSSYLPYQNLYAYPHHNEEYNFNNNLATNPYLGAVHTPGAPIYHSPAYNHFVAPSSGPSFPHLDLTDNNSATSQAHIPTSPINEHKTHCCRSCRNHGREVAVRLHNCPFANCPCPSCVSLREKRRNATQNRYL